MSVCGRAIAARQVEVEMTEAHVKRLSCLESNPEQQGKMGDLVKEEKDRSENAKTTNPLGPANNLRQSFRFGIDRCMLAELQPLLFRLISHSLPLCRSD
jgi:hypothetical protein